MIYFGEAIIWPIPEKKFIKWHLFNTKVGFGFGGPCIIILLTVIHGYLEALISQVLNRMVY